MNLVVNKSSPDILDKNHHTIKREASRYLKDHDTGELEEEREPANHVIIYCHSLAH